jgi:hypothetical protein
VISQKLQTVRSVRQKKACKVSKQKYQDYARNSQLKKTYSVERRKAEPGVSTLLFGSRVKSDRQTPAIKEIDRVSSATGKNITFTDWDKSTSTQLSDFKRQVGLKKYKEAQAAYGRALARKIESDMKNPEYKKRDDSDKLTIISDADSQALKATLKAYGYKKAAKTSSNLLKSFR